MSTSRVTGSVLAVVAALALVAASAQATPGSLEFGRCVAKPGGRYANAACTKRAKAGKETDEWEPLTSAVESRGAKERETGNAVIEAAGGTQVLCTGMRQSAGEFRNTEEAGIVWLFTGCEFGGFKCTTTGGKEGEVTWNALRGEPGVVTKEPKEEKDIIGIAFSPQSGTNDAEVSCGPAPLVVRGGVIVKMQADSTGGTTGELTNKMLSKFELEFVTEKGKQVPEQFEGGSPVGLQLSAAGAPFEEADLSMIYDQETLPKGTKIELRKCEVNVC